LCVRAGEAYAAALEQVFGDDPAVYVIRRVHTELTLLNPTLATEAAVARRWGAQACAAVVRTVTRHADDGELVMRFDDTADFVAHFLADLIDGVAWERWYYGAFQRYRQLGIADTVRRILIEYRDWFPAMFQRLERSGHARAVVSRLGASDAREVWREAILRVPHQPAAEELRVFVRSAMRVVDALALWAGTRPGETEVLEQYARASPARPDWKQPRALAQVVLDVLTFLRKGGWLQTSPREVVLAAAEAVAPLRWLDDDWLDREWLQTAIEAWLSEAPMPVAGARPASFTALQRRILEVLKQLLVADALLLDDDVEPERNAITLFAALAAAEPSLAAEPSAPAAIAWALDACKPLPASSHLVHVIASALGQSVTPSPSPTSMRVVETRLGGLFLLARALIDARLTQLAAALGAVPVSDVLLALVAEWTGEDPAQFDEGVLFWSGDPTSRIASPPPVDALREAIERLMRDRAAFAPSLMRSLDPDTPPLRAIASHLLRLWALWLPGFRDSSAEWLLTQFIRRRGVLRISASGIAVSLAPMGLDVVLDMAGYLAPVAAVPWLDHRRLTFTIDRSLA
jgi:hypothetical protein